MAETVTCHVLTIPNGFYIPCGEYPVRVSSIHAQDEFVHVWMTDGRCLVYSNGNHIFTMPHLDTFGRITNIIRGKIFLTNMAYAYGWLTAEGRPEQLRCSWDGHELNLHAPDIFVHDNKIYEIGQDNDIVTTFWASVDQIPDVDAWQETSLTLRVDGKWKASVRPWDEALLLGSRVSSDQGLFGQKPVSRGNLVATICRLSHSQGFISVFELSSGRRLGTVQHSSRNHSLSLDPTQLTMELPDSEHLVVSETSYPIPGSGRMIKVYNWKKGTFLWENGGAE